VKRALQAARRGVRTAIMVAAPQGLRALLYAPRVRSSPCCGALRSGNLGAGAPCRLVRVQPSMQARSSSIESDWPWSCGGGAE
jgi:hypothetical protein